MVEFKEIFNIYELEEFDQLFYASLPHLDAGNYHFEGQSLNSTEEKLAFLKEKMHLFAESPQGKAFIVKIDGKLVRIVAGVINQEDPDYIMWGYDLIGPDNSGSKAWVYGNKEPEFIRDHFKVKGYKMPVVYQGSEYNYHVNNQVPEGMTRTISAPKEYPRYPKVLFCLITIDFNYI
jgi:hypothetical protein